MIVTNHARQRWNERFPDMCIENTFAQARNRVGKKTKKKIKESCPNNLQYCSSVFRGRYMRMTRGGIVFVIAPPEVIITVFNIADR